MFSRLLPLLFMFFGSLSWAPDYVEPDACGEGLAGNAGNPSPENPPLENPFPPEKIFLTKVWSFSAGEIRDAGALFRTLCKELVEIADGTGPGKVPWRPAGDWMSGSSMAVPDPTGLVGKKVSGTGLYLANEGASITVVRYAGTIKARIEKDGLTMGVLEPKLPGDPEVLVPLDHSGRGGLIFYLPK